MLENFKALVTSSCATRQGSGVLCVCVEGGVGWFIFSSGMETTFCGLLQPMCFFMVLLFCVVSFVRGMWIRALGGESLILLGGDTHLLPRGKRSG